MNQESRATLEIIAPSVEEAVEQGLNELGLTRNQVDIEILDEGSKGLFGLGNRQARIRLTMKGETKEKSPQIENKPAYQTAADEEDEVAVEEYDEEEDDGFDDGTDFTSDLENVSAIAKATVLELLEKMNLPRATVEATIIEPDDEFDRPGVNLNILGEDLSILIGKQAETLNALQYITRLIVGKEIGRGINLSVDVEGYRARREQSLRHLARRMASQAVKTGRKQMLEPMPANERRIIHIELRDNEEVTTESVGEEPRRKVTIIPNH